MTTKSKLAGAIKKLRAIKPEALSRELSKPKSLEILACLEREQITDFEALMLKFHADGFKGMTALRKAIKAVGKSLPKPKDNSSRDEILAQPIKAAQLFRNEIRPNLLYFQSEWLAWNQSHYEASKPMWCADRFGSSSKRMSPCRIHIPSAAFSMR